jgi:hypothetical protein
MDLVALLSGKTRISSSPGPDGERVAEGRVRGLPAMTAFQPAEPGGAEQQVSIRSASNPIPESPFPTHGAGLGARSIARRTS